VIEFADWLADLVDLLAAYDVFFVGVYCPLEELERRERARGDRMIGEARDHARVVHTFGPYDYTLDSSAMAQDNARQLILAWKVRARPSAFQRMYAASQQRKDTM
jgi:chloramphenicol 3-O phosphotransferase